jgi:PAS domain S-box-containing protein
MGQEPGQPLQPLLRSVIDSSPSGLLLVDASGIIVLVNREIERLFGYSREELLGKSVDLLLPERFRMGHVDYRAGFMANPRARSMGAGRDLYGLRKNGSQVPVEIGLTPLVTEDGVFVLSSIVDITARKSAEERFRLAVESSPNGMVMVDPGGQIVLVNREIERMFGYQREELLGQSIELLVPDRFRHHHPRYRGAFFQAPNRRAMGAGRELFGLRKDGTELPVEIGLNPIETDEGLFVLSSIVDIGARQHAEEERRQLEEQLRHAQKLEAIGTLAGGIAHDFNNILGAIFGFGELLEEQVDTEVGKTDVRELLSAAERGRQLVRQILAFSRRQAIVRKPVAFGETVLDATRMLRPMLPSTVDLQVRISPETPRVLADGTGVHQVIMNLGTNALHAMPGGGVLEIAVEPFYVRDSAARSRPGLREGTYVVLRVKDSGVGMDHSVQSRAFEPFYTTKQAGSGTGLGLSIVRGIILDHEGAVELDSEPGRGTTVTCLFPTLEPGEEVVPSSVPPIPFGDGERILFVDDERSLVRIADRNLRDLKYRCTVETDSTRALAIFRESPEAFDILVTDFSMPGLSGIELAQAVHAIRPDLPILMATGFIEDIPPENLEASGVFATIRKPLTKRELGDAIHSTLHSRSP